MSVCSEFKEKVEKLEDFCTYSIHTSTRIVTAIVCIKKL